MKNMNAPMLPWSYVMPWRCSGIAVFSKLLVSKCCHRKPNLYVWDVTKQLWICGWWCDEWRSLFTLSSCYVCVTAVTIPTKRPTPGIHNPRGHVPKGLNSLHPCSSVRTVRSSKWWGWGGGPVSFRGLHLSNIPGGLFQQSLNECPGMVW